MATAWTEFRPAAFADHVGEGDARPWGAPGSGGAPREGPGVVLFAELRRLAAEEARADLVIGRGLLRLTTEFNLGHLGHSWPTDFAIGKLGCSWSHCRELMTIAEKLPALPILNASYRNGWIPRGKLRDVVRGKIYSSLDANDEPSEVNGAIKFINP